MGFKDSIRTSLIMPMIGVNLYGAPQGLLDGEAVLMQNCYFRKGIMMKRGSNKHSSAEVVASKPIVGLHRFYYGTSSKRLIVACGTNVSEMNDSTGVWTAIRSTQTDSKQTYMVTWGSVNKMYVGNGTDVPFSINSSLAATTLTAFPIDVVMMLPYRDRLLYFYNTDPSYIRWSGSYDDTTSTTAAQAVRAPGPGQITVLAPHSVTGTTAGIDDMVFVGKPTSVYLFSGTNLDPTAAGYDARIDYVGGASGVGVVAPRTVVSTPKGTIFLGSDRQVYIIPHGSTSMFSIGHKIRSNNASLLGIEGIPDAELEYACACYHDGFYKLAYAPMGATTNTRQFWLDVDVLFEDNNKLFGPWYGPMIGMSTGCFATQNGPSDDRRLLGGEDKNNGYVYRMNEDGIYTDNGTNIRMLFQSKYHTYSQDPSLDSRILQSEIESTNFLNTVTLKFYDTHNPVGSSIAIASPQGLLYWDEGYYYDEKYWQVGDAIARNKLQYLDQTLIGRNISTSIEYTSGNDNFQVFKIVHEAIKRPMPMEVIQ